MKLSHHVKLRSENRLGTFIVIQEISDIKLYCLLYIYFFRRLFFHLKS